MAKKGTRDVLLDYTYNELEKYGYFQASTTEILKKCKIPKGSMYHYFSSKHDLTLAVIKERVKPKTLKLLSFNSTKEAPIKSLIIFIEEINFEKKQFKHDLIFHRLYTEISSHDKAFKTELDEIYQHLIKNIEEVLNQSIKSTEIDTHKVSSFILSSLFGIISLQDIQAKNSLIDYINSLISTKKYSKKVSKVQKQSVLQGSLF